MFLQGPVKKYSSWFTGWFTGSIFFSSWFTGATGTMLKPFIDAVNSAAGTFLEDVWGNIRKADALNPFFVWANEDVEVGGAYVLVLPVDLPTLATKYGPNTASNVGVSKQHVAEYAEFGKGAWCAWNFKVGKRKTEWMSVTEKQ